MRSKYKNTLTYVRVFALAGAIGIEPTQWESEAQVLPLHQAPSQGVLYPMLENLANVFINKTKFVIFLTFLI